MQLVKVRYIKDEESFILSDREYTYFSEVDLKVGDKMLVPVRDTSMKAVVSNVDVDEADIAAFRDKVKVIPAGAKELTEVEAALEDKDPYPPGMNDGEINDEGLAFAIKAAEEGAERPWEKDETVAVETAIATIRVKPQQDPAVFALSEQAERLLAIAKERVILTDSDLTPATEDLSVIAQVKKGLGAIKAEYVKPIKGHLDDVNAAFNMILKPLEEADSITRAMMLAYRRVVEERARQAEEINRQKAELARKEAEFSGTGEFTVDTTPVEVAKPIGKVQTGIGSAGVMKVTKWELVDFAAVPDKYKVLDSAAITKLVKAGGSIPGIRVYEEETLRVNTR